MSFEISDINKLSKYTIRLKKSILNNDINKINEYYDHLKFHVQLGGVEPSELVNIDKIIEEISNNVNKKDENITNLKKELIECNKEETVFKDKNIELENKIKELNKELTEKIDLNKINEINIKDDKIKELNTSINNLNSTIDDLQDNIKNLNDKNLDINNKYNSINESLDLIFKNANITSDELNKKIEEVNNKINRYYKIINDTKKNINDIDNNDESKFNTALTLFVHLIIASNIHAT